MTLSLVNRIILSKLALNQRH